MSNELKRGDVIRNKFTGETGIFYSYQSLRESNNWLYALFPQDKMPQLMKDEYCEPTGDHIDIFAALKQSEPTDEKEKIARDLLNSMRDLFWNNDNKEKSMKNVNDYISGYEDTHNDPLPLTGGHPYGNCELPECTEDTTIVVDYDDFLALAQSDAATRSTLNYILKALRLGMDSSSILAVFDSDAKQGFEKVYDSADVPINTADRPYASVKK